MSNIRMCIDKNLPSTKAQDTHQRALFEAPSNAGQLRAALLRSRGWRTGRTLRVSFLDGSQVVHEKVQQIAAIWTQHANLKLQFGDSRDAEIRISFREPDVCWSYLGTEALSIPADQPTMNYGWLTEDTSMDEYQRVVLHEFGHALGLIHEHQHPQNSIPWDKDAVYRFFQEHQGWSKEAVDLNIFEKYDKDSLLASEYDRDSIMHYPVDPGLTIGGWRQGWNRELSRQDIAFITLTYPRTATPDAEAELKIGAAALAADTSRSRPFPFQITQAGLYILETSGSTDVCMELTDVQHHPVAQDDNSADGRNARMVVELEPGWYEAHVRDRWPRKPGQPAGAYAISLQVVE